MSLSELLNAAIRLPPSERGHLVRQLLQSFEETEDEGVEDAWSAELQLRAERLREAAPRGRSVDEVCDQLQDRLTR